MAGCARSHLFGYRYDMAVSKVGDESLPRVYRLRGADDMSVRVGKQTITPAVDALGVACLKPYAQHIDTMPANEDLAFAGASQALTEVVDTLFLIAKTTDEEGSHGGRGLERQVGNHIHDADVACMADTGQDGQWELGTVAGQFVAIEAPEVGGGTAAAYDNDGIKMLGFVADLK